MLVEILWINLPVFFFQQTFHMWSRTPVPWTKSEPMAPQAIILFNVHFSFSLLSLSPHKHLIIFQ